MLPYDRIISRPFRDQEDYSETSLRDLVLSIAENGMLEPVHVTAVDEQHYRIASGERRFRAAVMAGMTEIPCILINDTDRWSNIPYALIDELHHKHMHYLDQAAAIRRTLDEKSYNLYQLSEKLSVPLTSLSALLKLLELSDEVRDEIKKNKLPMPYAELLLKVEEENRRAVLEKIVEKGFSLREAKAYIEKTEETQCRGNIMVFKDLNVFVNTVEHAVETMNRSGIVSNIERTETERQIVYTIAISKNG